MASPSVADIRRRAIPRTLRVPISAGGHATEEVDPMQRAKEMKEALLSQRMMDQAMDEAETQAESRKIEFRTKRIEAELKELEITQRLAEARNASGTNGQTPMMDALLGILAQNSEALKEANEALRTEVKEAKDSQLTTVITQLREEISEVKRQAFEVSAGTREPDSATSILSRIEDIIKLREALSPLSNASPELAAAGSDIRDIIMLKRIEQDHHKWLEEIKDTRDEKAFDRSLQVKKLELDERRTNEFARMFDNLSPLIGMFARTRLGLPGESPPGAPSAGPMTAQSNPCQAEGCDGLVTFVTGQNVAPCPKCGMVYQLTQE